MDGRALYVDGAWQGTCADTVAAFAGGAAPCFRLSPVAHSCMSDCGFVFGHGIVHRQALGCSDSCGDMYLDMSMNMCIDVHLDVYIVVCTNVWISMSVTACVRACVRTLRTMRAVRIMRSERHVYRFVPAGGICRLLRAANYYAHRPQRTSYFHTAMLLHYCAVEAVLY